MPGRRTSRLRPKARPRASQGSHLTVQSFAAELRDAPSRLDALSSDDPDLHWVSEPILLFVGGYRSEILNPMLTFPDGGDRKAPCLTKEATSPVGRRFRCLAPARAPGGRVGLLLLGEEGW